MIIENYNLKYSKIFISKDKNTKKKQFCDVKYIISQNGIWFFPSLKIKINFSYRQWNLDLQTNVKIHYLFIQQTTINLNNIRIPSITFEKLLLTSKRCPLGIKMVFNFANFIIFNIYFTSQFYMIILKKLKI